MKVVFCLHHFLPEFVGGTEIYTLNLTKQLIERRIEVLVLIPNLGNDVNEEYHYEGVRVIKYAENSVEDRAMILGKKKPEGLKLFADLLIKEQPSLIHFHELAPGRAISVFHVEKAFELKIPIVLTFHVPYHIYNKNSKDSGTTNRMINIKKWTEFSYAERGITGIKAKILSTAAMLLYNIKIDTTGWDNTVGTALGYPFVIEKIRKDLLRLSFISEKIVAIADWYKEILVANNVPGEKMLVIKQGLANFKIEKRVKSLSAGPLRVVFLGRLTKLKGLDILIHAVLRLPPNKIHLDIYGDDSPNQFVDVCKTRTAANENIRWMGRIASNEVVQTLANYHLLCLPSHFEMSALVIQEAFAAGVPVLASNTFGNAEQIQEDKNGWLFDLNNNDLFEKLQRLINEPRLLEEVCENIPDVNTFEKVATKHIEMYEAMLRNYERN